ncbi:MAG TPA: ABC transporter permease subunit, partial [Rhizobiales bacterium]|nr:ABC transporter permease subunit [Hyphomicrobiales bacterium]
GLLNTIYVSFIGIVLATILGFIVGVMRLSKNWVISRVAAVYVEVLRNIPLLLQIIVWYTILLTFVPGKRSETSLFGILAINKTGLWTPAFVPKEGFGVTVIAFFVAIAASWLIARWARKRQEATGQPFPVFWTSVGLIIGLPLVTFLATGSPGEIDYPVFVNDGPMLRRGFQAGTGHVFIPEFLALLFALVLYTGTFIAEIVRAGILAVNYGQTEAAAALGLRQGKILRLVVIPQALRVIIPPLTSQYLNLTKNSSLAVAIAYPDVVSTGGIILNQSGQAVEVILMTMGVYLFLSIVMSIFMNWYNAHMALTER